MRDVARITGGQAFTTASAAELDQIYKQLGSQVSMRDEPREITAGFAGGAILFVLLAGALSLRWFGRLP
jgi:Ca-activated chloride channel family protein